MFINAAIEQRRIGAEMAYRRMIGMALRGLAAMDRNDDGQVSQREFMAGMAVLFERLDANGDGVLSEADMRAHAEHGAFGGNDQRFGGANGQNFGMPGMGQNFGGGMGPGFGGGFGPQFNGPMQGP